jgi:hypothetical protein
MKSKKNKLKHLKDQKKKHIQAKFSTISILKDEIDKNRFDKKNHIKNSKTKEKEKEKEKRKQNTMNCYCNP